MSISEVKHKLLIVEDEEALASLLAIELERFGYTVKHAQRGADCLPLVLTFRPDLILMDLDLGDTTGFGVCSELEANEITARTPIVFLSSQDSDTNIVGALDKPAVFDFISKRSSIPVLVARIQNVLRLVEPQQQDVQELEHGGVCLDPRAFRVTVDGLEISLTVSEFRFLQMLIEAPGTVFDRSAVIRRVHGENYPVTERSVDTLVKCVRQKLGKAGMRVETVRGAGYRFKQ